MSDTTKGAIAALETAGRRVKVHDAIINVKLPKTVKGLINEIAEKREVSDSQVIREALAEYLTRRGYNR